MPSHFPSNEEIVASLKQSSIELKRRQKVIEEIEKEIERSARQLDSIDWGFYSTFDAPFLIQHCRKYGKKANPVVFDVLREEFDIQGKELSILIHSNMDFKSLEHIQDFLLQTEYPNARSYIGPYSQPHQVTAMLYHHHMGIHSHNNTTCAQVTPITYSRHGASSLSPSPPDVSIAPLLEW